MIKQHVLALVAEVFGDGRGGQGRLHSQQRRLVAGGHDHHAPGQALRPQVALEEFVHFAAALADQADHAHVGRRVAGHHPQRDALAHARAGEDAHPLAQAAGQQAVDRPHAGRERRDRSAAARCAGGGAATSGMRSGRCGSGRPSMIRPWASITRPSSSGPTRSERAVSGPAARDCRAARRPFRRADRRASSGRESRSLRPRPARPFAARSRRATRPAPESRRPRRPALRCGRCCPIRPKGMIASSWEINPCMECIDSSSSSAIRASCVATWPSIAP